MRSVRARKAPAERPPPKPAQRPGPFDGARDVIDSSIGMLRGADAIARESARPAGAAGGTALMGMESVPLTRTGGELASDSRAAASPATTAVRRKSVLFSLTKSVVLLKPPCV